MSLATEKAVELASQFSPLNTGLLVVAISLLGLIFRHQINSRNTRIQEEKNDREGWIQLITQLREQVDRMETALGNANKRITTLEQEKETDHRLIVELFGQLNRTQAIEISKSNNLSPALKRMVEGSSQ